MLNALLDNFDVLGDTYSLPGVWGTDHHRSVCTVLELIYQACSVSAFPLQTHSSSWVFNCCTFSDKIALTANSDLWAAKWPSLWWWILCHETPVKKWSVFTSLFHIGKRPVCVSWGLVWQESFISGYSGLNSGWGLLTGRSCIPLHIPETALCPD